MVLARPARADRHTILYHTRTIPDTHTILLHFTIIPVSKAYTRWEYDSTNVPTRMDATCATVNLGNASVGPYASTLAKLEPGCSQETLDPTYNRKVHLTKRLTGDHVASIFIHDLAPSFVYRDNATHHMICFHYNNIQEFESLFSWIRI